MLKKDDEKEPFWHKGSLLAIIHSCYIILFVVVIKLFGIKLLH